ncbi:DUF305 domain-containing protein [Rhodococcoides fascians]|uniref:DUF305 domain-containing protein n=1 Tax=Rhodococcoides fascians TaxID=1828 RepID=UPI000B25E329|nr:DUF305 domain-containing protein [Rhodococcus fascians]
MNTFRTLTSIARGGAAASVVSLAVVLAGCSSGDDAPAVVDGTGQDIVGQVCCIVAPGNGAPMVNGISTEYNGWDTYMISWITPHDAVASQMAALAEGQAASQQVKDIAASIDEDTSTRYLRVSEIAVAWGQPIPSTDPASVSGHNHSAGASEAATAETLIPLTGDVFDREFLEIMIEHHAAVLPIAQNALAQGINQQEKEFAREVLDSQTAEIGVMQAILDSL